MSNFVKENIFQKRTIVKKEMFREKKFIREHFVCIFQLYPNLIVRFDGFFWNKVKSITVIRWTVTNLVFSIVNRSGKANCFSKSGNNKFANYWAHSATANPHIS